MLLGDLLRLGIGFGHGQAHKLGDEQHWRLRTSRGGPDIVLKCENLQRNGSCKIRGAAHRLSKLTPPERARGVAAVSAGNHAQGVALAAELQGVTATVYMAETASIAKIKATEGYVVLAGKSLDEARQACAAFVTDTDALYISPYDDGDGDGIITRQGTLGLELLEDVPDMGTVLVPIGGGGLFAGVATAIKEIRPNVRIMGLQAKGADSAVRSFQAGRLMPREELLRTICDGIAVKSPSPRTWAYIQKYWLRLLTGRFPLPCCCFWSGPKWWWSQAERLVLLR